MGPVQTADQTTFSDSNAFQGADGDQPALRDSPPAEIHFKDLLHDVVP